MKRSSRFSLLVVFSLAGATGLGCRAVDTQVSPIVSQTAVGEYACGPCALVNALLRARHPYRQALQSLDGLSTVDQARELASRFGAQPSQVEAGQRMFQRERGITWVDLHAATNHWFEGVGVPPLAGGFLDRRKGEPLSEHMQRVHRLLQRSIEVGMPVVASVRSFAPAPADDGGHLWHGLVGHYIAITDVSLLTSGDKGFTIRYVDSETGAEESGYVSFDEARNFTAAKGDWSKWEWLVDRPFLVVTAPSLRLGTELQPWHLRTVIVLNYALYAH